MPATLFMRTSILGLLLLCSCYKNHLYVQQEVVDIDFLASSHVHSPDPRRLSPPEGQRLLIGWDFPRSIFKTDLSLIATVRFWDNAQETMAKHLDRKRGYTAYFFPLEKRILTYRIQVMNGQGEIIETWEHHFWTELIDIDSSDSVSSQPRQASVIEIP